MANDSTTIIIAPERPSVVSDRPARGSRITGWLLQRDRMWLLSILLIMAALLLGGCHACQARSTSHTGCGCSGSDGILAAFPSDSAATSSPQQETARP